MGLVGTWWSAKVSPTQNLQINKDIFSTEGQEHSGYPSTVVCRGLDSLIYYRHDAVTLLCPSIRLYLCPTLTSISAAMVNTSNYLSSIYAPLVPYRKIICCSFSAFGFHKHRTPFQSVPSALHPYLWMLQQLIGSWCVCKIF